MFRFLLVALTAVTISACLPNNGEGLYAFIESTDSQALAKRYGTAEAVANVCGQARVAADFRKTAQKELAQMAKDEAALGGNAEPTWGTYIEAYKAGLETMSVPGAKADCDAHLEKFYKYKADVQAAAEARKARERAVK